MPIVNSGGGGGGGAGGGAEIGYTQITSNANVTDLAEATATALISPGALTFDGAPVLVTFFAVEVAVPGTSAGFIGITLFEGATEITRLAVLQNGATGGIATSVCAQYRFTPTVGAHTYKLCGWVSGTTGTPAIVAGAGGTAAAAPAFLRFTKV